MNQGDLALTMILLSPLLVGGVAMLAVRARPVAVVPRRRLTDGEVSRLHPVLAERMGRARR